MVQPFWKLKVTFFQTVYKLLIGVEIVSNLSREHSGNKEQKPKNMVLFNLPVSRLAIYFKEVMTNVL